MSLLRLVDSINSKYWIPQSINMILRSIADMCSDGRDDIRKSTKEKTWPIIAPVHLAQHGNCFPLKKKLLSCLL
jgi:hypothetical protein